jgi:hypothetical protein
VIGDGGGDGNALLAVKNPYYKLMGGAFSDSDVLYTRRANGLQEQKVI